MEAGSIPAPASKQNSKLQSMAGSPRHDQDDNLIGWQAIIRKRGFPSQTKIFRTKRDAEAWANVTESEMVRGVFVQRTESERTLLSDLLDRYAR
ncbi:MAG: hypothetical protein ACYCZC_05820, partial [Acidithiobacillus sp.]